MRKIKFKALRDGTWYHFDLTNGQEWDRELLANMRDKTVKFDTPMLQFTGLKDKNGVEIYEGDVLRQFTQHLVVTYHAAAFWAGDYQLRERWHSELEVIGNIYENPELLENQ